MDIGNFSLSLSVKDMARARAFYESFGFSRIDGDPEQGWLILKNGDAKIGLFAGMFEGNLITFNPPDARAIQATLEKAGYEPVKRADEGTGPTSFVIEDPDGNTILVDQHGPTPQ